MPKNPDWARMFAALADRETAMEAGYKKSLNEKPSTAAEKQRLDNRMTYFKEEARHCHLMMMNFLDECQDPSTALQAVGVEWFHLEWGDIESLA